MVDCLDSTLRNASHHKAMKLKHHGKTIKYQSGGTGSVKEIPYSGYLEKCNAITLSLACLYLVELELQKL